MGNPAMVKRKKTEKRRKKYEQRLGPGAYLPKDQRLALNAELEKLAKAETARLEQVKKDREAKKKEKRAKPAVAAPAAKDEKKEGGKKDEGKKE
jgi:hypothetical protein